MKEKIKKILSKHWPALILALVVGLLVVQPTISSILNIGTDNFKGVYPIFADDEEHYLARTQDVIDGHSTIGNAYIKEHKNGPYMFPPLTEWLFAKTAVILNVSVPGLFAVNDFIFPFITMFVLYGLILSLTSSRKISLITSFLFCILFVRYFGRAINPQFSFIFLVAGLLMVGKIYFLKENKNFKKIILYNLLLAVFFGILVYIYPYFWTTIVVVYFLALLTKAIIEKNFLFPIKSLAVFMPTAVIFSLPYLFNLVKAFDSPFYGETVLRMGMILTHWPATYYNAGSVIIMAATLMFARKKISKSFFYFCVSLLVTGLILNWQNVITGKYLLFSGHYFQATSLLVWLVFVVVINSIKDDLKTKNDLLKSSPIIVGLVVVLFILFYRQWSGIKMHTFTSLSAEKMTELQQMRPIFDWFNLDTQKDSVVLYFANDAHLYPIYTHNNMYFGFASPFLISNNEIEERWVRQNMFNDKIDEKYVTENNRGIWVNDFLDKYQNKEVRRKVIRFLTGRKGQETEMLPKEYAERVFLKYKKVKDDGLEKALKKYEIDYILLNRKIEDNKMIEVMLRKEKFLEPIKEFDDVIIFKVN